MPKANTEELSKKNGIIQTINSVGGIMSYKNENKADPKKVYSSMNHPPIRECGGKLDDTGEDTYWGPSLTLQSEKDTNNMQLIMDKYAKTGVLDSFSNKELRYGDQTQVPDYHTAQNQIARAHELFDSLDAKVRARFQNDPAKMIEFIADGENYHEALKLGLVNERQKDEPVKQVPKTEAPQTNVDAKPAAQV